MKRLHRVRNFKPYLMRYVHNDDPNYEPVLRELLDHEHEVYDELTLSKKELARDVLTPVQIEQLFERMEKDFSATCAHFREMAEAQRLLEQDEGGAG